MKEDYKVFISSFFYLEPRDKDAFEKYLSCGQHTEQLAYDLGIKENSLRVRMFRARKVITEQTSNILIRKYKFEGGKA